MKQITQRAATVELAIKSALQNLGVTRSEVEVEVVESGRKGFLGFGAKEAVVNITVNEKSIQPAPTKVAELAVDATKKVPPVITAGENIEDSNPDPLPTDLENSQDYAAENVLKDKAYNELEAIEETKAFIVDMAKEMGIADLVVTYETKGKYINFQLESEKAAFLIGKRGQTLNAIQQLAQLVANKVTKQFKIVRIDVADYRERREQSLEQLADRMADRAIRTKRQVALEPMPSYERKVIHNALSRRLDVETFSEGKDPYRHIVIKGFE
ncbi:protein jag [Sporosarcina sp. P13]|uniref:RNA-binding cell elongation regulator Jag/EloR n=1 Tax=Sporosarcina sp. P13 TaxID=2048263 RepID=UPI000C16675B|nr:RNA-binding cell elongation regulator Jag/EloR [Sporosarcina sp. P13]PIC63423.1 protein jag [Sporosarcina sp. P13]